MVTDCHYLGVIITGVTMSVLVIFNVILFLVFMTVVAVSRKTKSKMWRLRLCLDELQNNVLQLRVPSSCTANQEQHLVSPLENKLSQNEPEYAPV